MRVHSRVGFGKVGGFDEALASGLGLSEFCAAHGEEELSNGPFLWHNELVVADHTERVTLSFGSDLEEQLKASETGMQWLTAKRATSSRAAKSFMI